MAAPQAVRCPRADTSIEVVNGADETDGADVRVAITMGPSPRSTGPYLHEHPEQDETPDLESGRPGVVVDGQRFVTEAGERIDVDRGEPHRYWNAGPGELHAIDDVRPGLETDAPWPLLFALARDRPAAKVGIPPNPVHLGVVLDRYPDHLYLARIPTRLQKWTFGLLATAGRVLGYSVRPGDAASPPEERYCPIGVGTRTLQRVVGTFR